MDLVGGVDSQGGYVSKILYVKTKDFGPLGGRALGTPLSRSANALGDKSVSVNISIFRSFEK